MVDDPTSIVTLTSATLTPKTTGQLATETIHIPAPILRDDLISGCTRRDPNFASPKKGESAIDFSLRNVDGEEFALSQLLTDKPVYMISGSFT